MSPLYLQNGKLLVKDGALASSAACCCSICTCTETCQCFGLVDVNGFGIMGKMSNGGTFEDFSTVCGPVGPNGETGWLIGLNKAYAEGTGHWELFLTKSQNSCCPDNGTYTMESKTWQPNGNSPPPEINIVFYTGPNNNDCYRCSCPPVCQNGNYFVVAVKDGVTWWIDLSSVNANSIVWYNSNTINSVCAGGGAGSIYCYEMALTQSPSHNGFTWPVTLPKGTKYILISIPDLGDIIVAINNNDCSTTVYTHPTFQASVECINNTPWPAQCSADVLPDEWEVYDTTNSKVLQSGTVTVNNGNKTITLNGLDDQWKPLGYWSPSFSAVLRFTGSASNLDEWNVAIPSCPNSGNRYPVHDFGEIKKTYCVPVPNTASCYKEEEYTIVAGGANAPSTRVTVFHGKVDTEYTNLFNWTDATYDNQLPNNTTPVTISGECLSTASAAVCNHLTINSGKLFGITISASGSVSVINGTHVCDQKYNSCGNRGIINASGGLNEPSIQCSDNLWYEYLGAVQFYNARLSGTINYTGPNKCAIYFDACNITDSATITGGTHIYLNNTDITYMAIPAGCNSVATPVYNGKWLLRGSSHNYGGVITTAQFVRFFDTSSNLKGGSTNNDPGTITTTTPVKFYDTSHNGDCSEPYATITNDAEFYTGYFGDPTYSPGSPGSYNAGKVGGTATFYDTSYFKCGEVLGDYVDFNDESWNEGTIDNCKVYFHDNSYNKGHIDHTDCENGQIMFYDNSKNGSNSGTCDGLGTIDGNVVFNNSSSNRSDIEGDCTFNNSSYNYVCGVITGDCTFLDSSRNGGFAVSVNRLTTNAPEIHGNVTFGGTCENQGFIYLPNAGGTCTFNGSSRNVSGYVTYEGTNPTTSVTFCSLLSTANQNTGNGNPGETVISYVLANNVVFNDAGNYGEVQVISYCTFNGNFSSNNVGALVTVTNGDCIFNDQSTNLGAVISYT